MGRLNPFHQDVVDIVKETQAIKRSKKAEPFGKEAITDSRDLASRLFGEGGTDAERERIMEEVGLDGMLEFSQMYERGLKPLTPKR